MKTSLLLQLTVATLLMGCLSNQNKTAGYYNYKTECLGVEMDGSQTLKVWGSGRNHLDALEQAKKNGVRDVLFKGITDGKPECNMKPVVPEVNAQEKYEDYFNKFFADNGPYKNFISYEDASRIQPEIIKSKERAATQVTYRTTIRVHRSELKEQMIKDGILKN